MSKSHWLTEPGETSKDEGSKDVEAEVCPCRARPIGVEACPGASGVVGGFWALSDFILASSASNSRMRCWLALSADGWEGSQD